MIHSTTEIDRRQWLHSSGAALAGVAIGHSLINSTVAQERKPMLPIVDTHQHLWDLTKFQCPWLAGAPEILKRSYVTKDYLEAIAGLNIEQAVYMEVDVNPDLQVAEAEHLIQICQTEGAVTKAAVISGRPASDEFANYLNKFKGSPYIKGVRQVLHVDETPAGHCITPSYIRGVRLLGERGLSFDLCMRPMELRDATRLADQCPDTRLILDHCGNGDPKAFRKPSDDPADKPWHDADTWKRWITELAKRKNVICKISGIVARAPKGWTADDLAPLVNHCLDEFGADRVIFGSDWPVCLLGATLRQWVESLRAIISNRPEADQRKLLRDNAVRLYGLKG